MAGAENSVSGRVETAGSPGGDARPQHEELVGPGA